MTPTTSAFQNDVTDMVRANQEDPAAAAKYLNDLVEVQVITADASRAIWDDVMGASGGTPGAE
jgi:hypothetical protein